MKNKVLVEIYLAQMDETFNIYLPLNKNIANVIELICKSISEFRRIENLNYRNLSLYNRETSYKYNAETLIKDSNIRNGYRLILM